MTLFTCRNFFSSLHFFEMLQVWRILNFINEELPSIIPKVPLYFVCFKLHSTVLKVIWKSYNKKYLKFPFISWLKIGLMLMNEGEQILNFCVECFLYIHYPKREMKGRSWKWMKILTKSIDLVSIDYINHSFIPFCDGLLL